MIMIWATADNIFSDGEMVEEITKHINNIGQIIMV